MLGGGEQAMSGRALGDGMLTGQQECNQARKLSTPRPPIAKKVRSPVEIPLARELNLHASPVKVRFGVKAQYLPVITPSARPYRIART